jgi:hypothetical protein
MNKALGDPIDHVSETMQHRIASACEPLVKAMLFCEEAPLTDKVEGSPAFVRDFTSRGPRDLAGRSLRDFDLNKRLFKYPCSFLIYSDSFKALPAAGKKQIYHRLFEIVSGKDTRKDFAHLSPEDRKAIRQILAATIPDLPEEWRE